MALIPRFMVVGDLGLFDSPDQWLAQLARVARALVGVQGAMLQVRTKGQTASAANNLAGRALAAMHEAIEAGLQVVRNGNIRTYGYVGVHLPQQELEALERVDTLRPGTIGASVHDPDSRAHAAGLGLDYVVASPVFTPTWKPVPGRGLDWLAGMARPGGVPVLALGGVTPQRVAACLDAGAHGVAVTSAVMKAVEPGAIINDYLAAFDVARRRSPAQGAEHVV